MKNLFFDEKPIISRLTSNFFFLLRKRGSFCDKFSSINSSTLFFMIAPGKQNFAIVFRTICQHKGINLRRQGHIDLFENFCSSFT